VVEGWLIADPAVSAKTLMQRLATLIPEAYASQAQLRTLQRRVKAWRAERAAYSGEAGTRFRLMPVRRSEVNRYGERARLLSSTKWRASSLRGAF
jgi:hypothetical protein